MTTPAPSSTRMTGARRTPLVFALLAILCALGPRTARAHMLAAPATVSSYGGTRLGGMDLGDCLAVRGMALESPLPHRGIVGLSVGLASGRVLPGQYADAETGLSYNWHRYYSAAIGRYVQQDPLLSVGDPSSFTRQQALQAYTYALANPIRHVDRDGRDPGDNGGGGGGASPVCGGGGDPAELQRCLAACAGGTEAMDAYCYEFPTPQLQALCLAASTLGGATCAGFCYARFAD